MSRQRSTYDPGMDKVHWSTQKETGGVTRDGDPIILEVAIMSYGSGPLKIALRRPTSRFNKLGRLTLEEATTLRPLIEEAVRKLELLAIEGAVDDEEEEEKEEEKPKPRPQRKKRKPKLPLGNSSAK